MKIYRRLSMVIFIFNGYFVVIHLGCCPATANNVTTDITTTVMTNRSRPRAEHRLKDAVAAAAAGENYGTIRDRKDTRTYSLTDSFGKKEATNPQKKLAPCSTIRNKTKTDPRSKKIDEKMGINEISGHNQNSTNKSENCGRVRRSRTVGQDILSIDGINNIASQRRSVDPDSEETSEDQQQSSVEDQMPFLNFDEEDEEFEAVEDESVEKRSFGRISLDKASLKDFEDKIFERAFGYALSQGLVNQGKMPKSMKESSIKKSKLSKKSSTKLPKSPEKSTEKSNSTQTSSTNKHKSPKKSSTEKSNSTNTLSTDKSGSQKLSSTNKPKSPNNSSTEESNSTKKPKTEKSNSTKKPPTEKPDLLK